MKVVTQTDIRKTFDAELCSLLPDMGLTIKEVAWQNANFEAKNQRLFLQPYLLPAQDEATALGYPCFVLLSGVYQVSFFQLKNTGLEQMEKAVDVLLSAFPIGRVLDCCGRRLVVNQSYRGTTIEEEGRAMTPVSLAYYCHVWQGR